MDERFAQVEAILRDRSAAPTTLNLYVGVLNVGSVGSNASAHTYNSLPSFHVPLNQLSAAQPPQSFRTNSVSGISFDRALSESGGSFAATAIVTPSVQK